MGELPGGVVGVARLAGVVPAKSGVALGPQTAGLTRDDRQPGVRQLPVGRDVRAG